MIDETAAVRDYLAKLEDGVTHLPRDLFSKELEAIGLTQESPISMVVQHHPDDQIPVDMIREMTAASTMELTSGDKRLFSEILDPVIPNELIPVSYWKNVFLELELSQAHPFMQELYDKDDTVEMNREEVHWMARDIGLDLAPLGGAEPDKVNLSAEEAVREPEPEGAEKAEATAVPVSEIPEGEAPLPKVKKGPPGEAESPQQKPQAEKAPNIIHNSGPLAGVGSGAASIVGTVAGLTKWAAERVVGDPFSAAKSLYMKSRQDSKEVLAGAGDPHQSAKEVAENISRYANAYKEGDKEALEGLAKSMEGAKTMMKDPDSLDKDDFNAIKKGLEDAEGAMPKDPDGIDDEKEKDQVKGIQKMLKALTALLSKLFGRKKEGPEDPSPGSP